MTGFNDPIVGGQGKLIRQQIESPNYVPGVSGWIIRKDGTVEFNAGVFRGSITDGGLFTYNGVPGLGNPPIFSVVAPGVIVDPYGNTVSTLLNAGSLSGGHFGIGSDGTVFISNSAGKTVIRIDTATGSMWFYNSSGEALGNLILSIAPVGGVDRVGNAYLGGGIAVYKGGETFFMGVVGTLPIIELFTGSTNEAVGGEANIAAGIVNLSLANEYMTAVFSGPKGAAVGGRDWVQTGYFSNQADTTGTASWHLVYIDDTQVAHDTISMTSGGVSIKTGTMTGVQPGTGTVATPAVQETWHNVSGGIGFTNAWTDTGAPLAKYRLLGSPPNSVQVTADISHAAFAGSSSPFTLPVGYRPASQQSFPPSFIQATNVYVASATSPLVTVTTAGLVNIQSMPTATTRVVFSFILSLDA